MAFWGWPDHTLGHGVVQPPSGLKGWFSHHCILSFFFFEVLDLILKINILMSQNGAF
jgi:hypothetical protein